MDKRIRQSLTIKEAKTITMIFAAFLSIISITAIVIGVILNKVNANIIVLCLCVSAVPITILSSMLWTSLQSLIELDKISKEKEIIISFLSKEEFKEVIFIPKVNENKIEMEMILKILEELDCKFYAKLGSDDTIILIVEDETQEEIYDCEISDYSYFNAAFKEKLS